MYNNRLQSAFGEQLIKTVLKSVIRLDHIVFVLLEYKKIYVFIKFIIGTYIL